MTVFQRLPTAKAVELTIRWYARYGPRLVEKVRGKPEAKSIRPQAEAGLAAIYAAALVCHDAIDAAERRSAVETYSSLALLGVALVGWAVFAWHAATVWGAIVLFGVAILRGFDRLARVPRFRQVYAKLEKEAEALLEAP